MNSCFYECNVYHSRMEPKRHKFNHKLFLFYLDLDELDLVCGQSRLIGHNRFSIYEFRDQDHMRLGGTTARENVIMFAKSQGLRADVSRVTLLTHLRALGHLFNPVSFYFLFDIHNRPLASVAEVTNTFMEMKLYYLAPETFREGHFKTTLDKFFYISPFMDLDNKLEFNVQIPGENISIQVDGLNKNIKIFYSGIQGRKKAISDKQLIAYSLRFPMVTLKVIGAIHWHALRLYWKGVPYRKKQDQLHLQKNVIGS